MSTFSIYLSKLDAHLTKGAPPMTTEAKLWTPDCWDYLPTAPDQIREALRDILKERFAHRSIDETATIRRTLEDSIVEQLAHPDVKDTFAILISRITSDDLPVPASGMLTVANIDLHQDNALEGLAFLESDTAFLTDIVPIQDNPAVVALRDHDLQESSEPWRNPQGRELWEAMQVLYRVTNPQPLPDVFKATTRELSIWVPVPDMPHTILIHFTFPTGPLANKLTAICLETASCIDFRTIPAPPTN